MIAEPVWPDPMTGDGTSRNFSAMQNSVLSGAWRTSSKPSPRSIWLKLPTGLPYLYGEPLPGRATSGQGPQRQSAGSVRVWKQLVGDWR
jgi:hypothetical protein